MTLKMTTAQVVEMSVTVTNSSFQNHTHRDDHSTQNTGTPGFKPFTIPRLYRGGRDGVRVVVTRSSKCRATHHDISYLDSNQKEADTKLLLHAVDVTTSGDMSMETSSPDTDVFSLCMLSFAV